MLLMLDKMRVRPISSFDSILLRIDFSYLRCDNTYFWGSWGQTQSFLKIFGEKIHLGGYEHFDGNSFSGKFCCEYFLK